ncbi:MAG: ZPR1 zinc finger domain-containing protein [Promethearchaeota archaeon]
MNKSNAYSEDKFSFKCPVCEEGILEIFHHVHDLPDGDKMLIIKFECNHCNFHKNDIIPLTTNVEAGIMTLRISCPEDLKSKIYRSPTGKLEIPELGLLVEPGPKSDFYITNVEGILERFKEAVLIFLKDMPPNDPEREKIVKILEDLDKALEGNLNFTVILTDSEGGSYILPVNASTYSFQKIDKK